MPSIPCRMMAAVLLAVSGLVVLTQPTPRNQSISVERAQNKELGLFFFNHAWTDGKRYTLVIHLPSKPVAPR